MKKSEKLKALSPLTKAEQKMILGGTLSSDDCEDKAGNYCHVTYRPCCFQSGLICIQPNVGGGACVQF